MQYVYYREMDIGKNSTWINQNVNIVQRSSLGDFLINCKYYIEKTVKGRYA